MRKSKKQMKTKRSAVKRTIRDSVFTDIFKIRKYQLQLYKNIHPEDEEATEEDIKNITIKNVLTNSLYNDLSFSVRDVQIFLFEAQSVYTVNIIIRILLYLAKIYQRYIMSTKQNLYGTKKVMIPKPEMYMVYTGERGEKPDIISLSEEYFGGEDVGLELKVKVIYDDNSSGIINEYIAFSKEYDRQKEKYGATEKAIRETIRICKDKNILKEYLENREMEVVSIMMSLFDDDEIMEMYVASERHEAAEKAAKKERQRYNESQKKNTEDMARAMIQDNKLSIDDIAKYSGLTIDEVNALEKEVMQLT